MNLIGKNVIVYDRYLFAVPVEGCITDISKKDGAYAVVFFSDNPGGHNVNKHDGKYFHHQQCKLVKEEPVKIQTEYEHKLERSNVLRVSGDPDHGREYKELIKWLENNKPEKWVQCDDKNTFTGDIVREITSKHTIYGLAKVSMWIENNPSFDVVVKFEHNARHIPGSIYNYEINTYKDKE